MSSKSKSNQPTVEKVLWPIAIMLVAIGVLNFGPWLNISNDINTIVTLLAGLGFVVFHGAAAWGWRNLVAFLVITFAISFSSEALGVATGLVFGKYYYTDLLGPKILGVPPMIQVGYIATGYASLIMARVILGMIGPIKKWSSVFAATLVGAMIMVSWDVAMDPYQSTVGGDWIWQEGGPYFGVGLHNYAGWFVTVFLFMFAYLLYARRNQESTPKEDSQAKLFWALPVLYYALLAIGIMVIPWVGGVALPYASPGNYTGTLSQLTHSMTLVATFVMGTPVAITLSRLFTSKKLQPE